MDRSEFVGTWAGNLSKLRKKNQDASQHLGSILRIDLNQKQFAAFDADGCRFARQYLIAHTVLVFTRNLRVR
jgi:hypothetical protein